MKITGKLYEIASIKKGIAITLTGMVTTTAVYAKSVKTNTAAAAAQEQTARKKQAAAITQEEMAKIYEEVKTPYKYGMVVAPKDNYHKIDCPTVYREDNKWYMTYVVYNGKTGLDGRGYETWLAESDNLLEWKTLGRLLSYKESGWDMNQRGGFPALIDWNWGGSYRMEKFKRRHWMTYIGGEGTGYEGVRAPLNIGMAWTAGGVDNAHEWQGYDRPLMSINDKDCQWWEKLIQYKSTIYKDDARTLGKRFVMFYNAGGVNPANGMKAERIGIALSNDLRKWTRYGGNPVFTHEVKGIITGDAQIVRMGDLYVMFWFSAFNPSRPYNAFNTFAVSRDLVNWQEWQGNDLIYPTKPYDEMFAHKSYVLKHDGVVYHFYCAVNNAEQRGIAVATSVPMGKSAVSFPQPEKKGRRTRIDLTDKWQTTMGSETRTVSLPHNWDDYGGARQLRHGNLHGTATYTKSFTLNKAAAGRRYFLTLEGAGSYATVIVNGKKGERTLVGRTTMTADVTDRLTDGQNTIEIITEHPAMDMVSPWVCGGCSSEYGFSEGSQPLGLFRPVYITETDEVRIEPFGVHIWNNDRADSVFVETEVKNYGSSAAEVEYVNKLALASGKQVFRLSEKLTLQPGETKTVRQSARIDNPILWTVGAPYLYNLASMIKRGGKTTDEITTPYGIRTLTWPCKNPSGDHRFFLNGKPTFINGVCEYEHQLGQSHAFSSEQIAARIKEVRQMGFNAFREAHQPHNLEYQKLLDREGILFWSQFSAHIWYDSPQFRTEFKRLLRQWVRERRNSPSIVAWGLQNESVLPADFARECSDIIREMDPTARTMRVITTCNGGEGTDWNVIQNWSGTYGGSAKNYGKELRQPVQLLNGEYGAWRTIGLHSEAKDLEKEKAYSEEKFTSILETKMLLAESAKDSVCGHFQWIMNSHDNPGRTQPDEGLRMIDKIGPFNHKGLTTVWEQPTDAFQMYRAHHTCPDTDPMVYIVSHTWSNRFKETGSRRTDINVYSNCDSVLLYNDATDNEFLGRKKVTSNTPHSTPSTHLVWENRLIKYNVLRAVGYRNGKPAAEDIIIYSGLPQAPHFDALYSGSTIVPTPADRNADLLRGAEGYNYVYRINCGGNAMTDEYGQQWTADGKTVSHSWGERYGMHPMTASQTVTADPIHGTRSWALFQSSRYGKHLLSYNLPVPDGDYRIELYFSEPWVGEGSTMRSDCEGMRLFDVAVNGKTLIDDLDIWAEAGHDGALKKVVYAKAENGKLIISFPESKAGQAIISAIAVATKGAAEFIATPNDTDWDKLSADTAAKLPKELMPKDVDERPAAQFTPAKSAKGITVWKIQTGLGKEYALRFRYKNTTGEPVTAVMRITDSKGAMLVDREITFPVNPKKFKTLSTTTGIQINAGSYTLTVTAKQAGGLAFERVDVQ